MGVCRVALGNMRVAIIGNSGSGKSALARQLAFSSGAAVLDLDTIAWVPGQVAVPQDSTVAAAAVEAFCTANPNWVVEGCYASLIAATFVHQPDLIFLDPGVAQCVANCRSRPWEPHKYSSKAEQDQRLAFLIGWVEDYYVRQGDMSLAGHAALLEAYAGAKQVFHSLPGPDFSLTKP